ncbi:hypothetical protein K1719_034713 [Acacia pycnantha]|nr:hypothetical protein K1719_034713 [Acacia pycnantha]
MKKTQSRDSKSEFLSSSLRPLSKEKKMNESLLLERPDLICLLCQWQRGSSPLLSVYWSFFKKGREYEGREVCNI